MDPEWEEPVARSDDELPTAEHAAEQTSEQAAGQTAEHAAAPATERAEAKAEPTRASSADAPVRKAGARKPDMQNDEDGHDEGDHDEEGHPPSADRTLDLPPVLRLVEPEGPSVDPMSIPQRALLTLFENHTALRFPGIDHAVLEGEAQTVRALAIAVDRARAALALAENALAERQRELQRVYVQAHEYASIFARDDESLRAELDAITLRGNDTTKRKRRQDDDTPKRRGRPPKNEAAELPFSAG